MKLPTSRASFRIAVGVIFVAMTMIFITVPYALSAHPGEAQLHSAGTASGPDC
jgi:hypothetical protein